MNNRLMIVDGVERLMMWWERIPIGIRLTDPCRIRSQSSFAHFSDITIPGARGEYEVRLWWLDGNAEAIVQSYLVDGALRTREKYVLSQEVLSKGLKHLGITRSMVNLVRSNLRKLPRYE